MVVFKFKDKDIYIDGGLSRQLQAKIFPELKKRDKDVVFCVDGKERSGKSKFADSLAAFASINLESHYDLDSVCMTPDEFKSKVMSANKNDVIIYDEAHRGMGSRRALSEINNILVDLMMEMGQKNLFIIIVLPTFFMLDRYPALYRTRGLFHIYERRGARGNWTYYNEKLKMKLYLLGKKFLNYNCMRFPPMKGRFTNQWAIDEEAYRKKKAHSFEEAPRITKADRYISQRDALLYLIHLLKPSMSSLKVERQGAPLGLALKARQIRDIWKKKAGEVGKASGGG